MKTVLATVLVIAQDGDWDHMDWDNGWWIVMMIGMVLFWALVVVAIVVLVRHLGVSGHAARPEGGASAMDILERRLADGSISIEEYEERRRVLSGSSAEEGSS